MLCWITAWRCRRPSWQCRGWWDLLFLLLLITWCAKPCMSSTLKLARLATSWLSILAVSKLQVVRKTALFLPQDTLSSCSVRALREHCWLLPVIASKWQSQRLPRAGRLNHAWWGFAFLFFWSLFSFCPQTVKYTDPYRFNAVRKVKEHKGGQRKQNGRGSGQVGCGAFLPVSAGIKVTHWYINAEVREASPTFPASEIIYCGEMIQWP